MPHDPEQADLAMRIDGEFDRMTGGEVRLIESYLGDLIQAILLNTDEKR